MSDVSQGPGWWQASDGKWYSPQATPGPAIAPPPQPVPGPTPAPKKRGRGCLYGVLGLMALIVIIIVIAAVGGGGGGGKSPSTNAASGTTASSPATTTKSSAPYKIPGTAKTGGLQVTVYEEKDPQPPTNQFSNPATGSHFVSFDVQITNPGSSQVAFSSVFAFHLLDSVNRQYDENIASGVTPSAPDGEIAGGQSMRGFVVFEVPDGTTGLKLRVQGGLTAAGALFSLQ